MEHKLDELQNQQHQLAPSNLSKPTEVADLQHELQQLTSANEASTHREGLRHGLWLVAHPVPFAALQLCSFWLQVPSSRPKPKPLPNTSLPNTPHPSPFSPPALLSPSP